MPLTVFCARAGSINVLEGKDSPSSNDKLGKRLQTNIFDVFRTEPGVAGFAQAIFHIERQEIVDYLVFHLVDSIEPSMISRKSQSYILS
jgi:hypothetical protein